MPLSLLPILIDISPLQGDSDRGIGRYTELLVKGLTSSPFSTSIRWLVSQDRPKPDIFSNETKLEAPHFLAYPSPSPIRSERQQKKTFLRALAKRMSLGMIHFPAQYCFVDSPIPSLVTLHDMVPFVFRKAFYRWDYLAYAIDRFRFKQLVKQVTHIISISQQTKNDIQRFASAGEEKISVVYNGIDDFFFSPVPSVQGISSMLKKYQIDAPYLLYVGSIEPRKNVANMLVAFKKCLSSFIGTERSLQLVLVGRKESDHLPQLKNLIVTQGLQKNVTWLEVIPREDLKLLYRGAKILLFPTLYEGFGYPPLEAMACGTPVIASDIPIFSEILGKSAYLVNPYDVEAIAQAILHLLQNQEAANQLALKGKERAEAYRLEAWIQKITAIYQQILCRKA